MTFISKRIFVSNLPHDVTESEIKKKFNKFGNVLGNIEIKKRNDVNQSTFAFMDFESETNKLDSCFHTLSKENWRDHYIKVELAKESFLSRLQRERQQGNVQSSQDTLSKQDHGEKRFIVKNEAKQSYQMQTHDTKQKVFSSKNVIINGNGSGDTTKPEDSQSSAIFPTSKDLLTKFESFSDVWKDPPTFQKPISKKKYVADNSNYSEYVPKNDGTETIKNNRNEEKLALTKNIKSEEKRLQSVNERKMCLLQQKEAVKLALAHVDSRMATNKKIIFDDDIVTERMSLHSSNMQASEKHGVGDRGSHVSSSKPMLFDEDSDGEEEHNFQIRTQFEGKKGQRLLELQSKYANDKRFALDERFYESEDDAEENHETPPEECSLDDERKRQMEILKSVIGDDSPYAPEKKKRRNQVNDNMVVHYDPTREDHAKYEIKQDETTDNSKAVATEKKRERKLIKKRVNMATPSTPTATNEKFYKVSDSLKQSMKASEGKSFSLLEMFGSVDDKKACPNKEEDYSFATSSKSKAVHRTSNPFRWDSSESEDEADEPKVATVPEQQKGPVQVQGIWRESFFFKPDDVRLKDGLEFFGKREVSDKPYHERRRELRLIIQKKINHNLQKLRPKRRQLGGKKSYQFKKH